MKSRVRKAIFPAAGLGTRFLPATKAQPKEMLPLVDKPIIQYGVEEAVGSGVDHIILVTGRGKNAIEDHFDVSIELETFLESRGKTDQLDEIRKISSLISVAYVRQGEPLGLGHAVLVTRDLVGDEPFAVILADDVIDADPPALAQMIRVYEEVQGPVILVERVPPDQISSYGVIAAEPVRPGVYRITDLVEKPPREQAPSDLAIIGRYILTPDIFEMLEETAKDRRRRNSVDQRVEAAAREAPAVCVRSDRHPPRHRQQARLPEGRGVFRAAAARSGRAVPGVSTDRSMTTARRSAARVSASALSSSCRSWPAPRNSSRPAWRDSPTRLDEPLSPLDDLLSSFALLFSPFVLLALRVLSRPSSSDADVPSVPLFRA